MVSKVLPMVLEVREYLSSDGASPFGRWRRRLDPQVRARMDRVIERFGATGSTTGLMGRCWSYCWQVARRPARNRISKRQGHVGRTTRSGSKEESKQWR